MIAVSAVSELSLPGLALGIALFGGLLISCLALLRSRKEEKASASVVSPRSPESPPVGAPTFKEGAAVKTKEPRMVGTLVPSTGLLPCNPLEAYDFENEHCVGKFVPLHRPTADPKLDASGDYPFGDHFKGRKRLWEMRIQIRPKHEVDGNMLIGTELENYVPLNGFAKRAMGITVAALRRVVGNDLYHSVGDDPRGPGPHEKPIFMMPLWAFDQIIETPEGETPPDLTCPHFATYGKLRADDPQEYAKEMSELKLTPGKTYTLVFWGISQFLDVIRWKVQKVLPLPIDFDLFAGAPPVNVVLYTLSPSQDGETRHLQSRKSYYFKFALWSSARPPSAAKMEELVPMSKRPQAAKANDGGGAPWEHEVASGWLHKLTLAWFGECCMAPKGRRSPRSAFSE